MANPMRGEVVLASGGRRLKLCLTMGALAEIEGAIGGRTLETITGDDAMAILSALLRGGGEIEAAMNVERLEIDPAAAMRAVAAALLLAGAG